MSFRERLPSSSGSRSQRIRPWSNVLNVSDSRSTCPSSIGRNSKCGVSIGTSIVPRSATAAFFRVPRGRCAGGLKTDRTLQTTGVAPSRGDIPSDKNIDFGRGGGGRIADCGGQRVEILRPAGPRDGGLDLRTRCLSREAVPPDQPQNAPQAAPQGRGVREPPSTGATEDRGGGGRRVIRVVFGMGQSQQPGGALDIPEAAAHVVERREARFDRAPGPVPQLRDERVASSPMGKAFAPCVVEPPSDFRLAEFEDTTRPS